MGVSLNVQAFAGKNSEEFQKHYKAVKFCIENGLSYPKETSEFFKGKVGGDNLEDIVEDAVLRYIENGVEVDLKITSDDYGNEIRFNVSDIPNGVDEIVVSLS